MTHKLDIVVLFATLMVLLQIKHLLVDFYFQTDEMVRGKGILFNLEGIKHSVMHAFGSWIAILVAASFCDAFILQIPSHVLLVSYFLCMLDGIFHYIIDYVKMNYVTRDIKTKEFWVGLGCDQALHQLGYVMLAYYFLIIIFGE